MIYEFAFKNFSSYKSMADLLCSLRNWKIQLKYQQLRIHITNLMMSVVIFHISFSQRILSFNQKFIKICLEGIQLLLHIVEWQMLMKDF